MARAKNNDEIIIPTNLKFSKVIVWIMYIWVLIGVIALSMRVFLLAFSANTSAGFTEFVMKVSADYLEPFRGIFPTAEVGETGYLDISAIFAIIVYLFILWGFRSLIDYVQNKIDLDKAMQSQKISEAKRQAELARQADLLERQERVLQEKKEMQRSKSKSTQKSQPKRVS
jgi:uncharacterized protein YggT (Ycf19 family)